MKDLALLVADKNMDYALRGILGRHRSLRMRPVSHETTLHPGRDGGMRTSGPETLARLQSEFAHGILILDWEGSGTDHDTPKQLEEELNHRLNRSGWNDRARTIVIEPELDVWIWGSDYVLREVLGWEFEPSIRDWLLSLNHEFDENSKPSRPKEALEAVMVRLSEPRSSSLYQKVTSRISLDRCVDPAFLRLKMILQQWFPLR